MLASGVILDHAELRRVIFPLVLLRLAASERLSQLVITAAVFKALQQVLAIDVLDYWALHDARQALEDAAAAAIFVDINDSVGLTNVVTLDAGCLLRTLLLAAGDVGRGASCGGRSRSMLAGDLVEVSLLLRHHVKIADQVRDFCVLCGATSATANRVVLIMVIG